MGKKVHPPYSVTRGDSMPVGHFLSGKQAAFVQHYIATNDAPRAYELAYGRKGSGQSQLKNPDVRSEIERLRQAVERELVIDRYWIIERLARVAQVAMGEVPHVTISTLDDGSTVTTKFQGMNLSEARQALTQLGKIDEIGLFVERQHIEQDFDFSEMSDDELRQFVDGTHRSLLDKD
jgi:hypothetical protein